MRAMSLRSLFPRHSIIAKKSQMRNKIIFENIFFECMVDETIHRTLEKNIGQFFENVNCTGVLFYHGHLFLNGFAKSTNKQIRLTHIFPPEVLKNDEPNHFHEKTLQSTAS